MLRLQFDYAAVFRTARCHSHFTYAVTLAIHQLKGSYKVRKCRRIKCKRSMQNISQFIPRHSEPFFHIFALYEMCGFINAGQQRVSRHYGLGTLWTQDILALVLNYPDISVLVPKWASLPNRYSGHGEGL